MRGRLRGPDRGRQRDPAPQADAMPSLPRVNRFDNRIAGEPHFDLRFGTMG
jgi:hypothetical protein